MGETKVPEQGSRSAWPMALLIVTSVAAISVALGLTVVGPIIQRRMETPLPVLPVSSPAPAPPVETARADAEVQIKERVIPRPKPKPPPELVVPLTLPGESASLSEGVGRTPGVPTATATRPAIRATISEGDRTASQESPRDSARGAGSVEEEGSGQARDGDSKSRRRRLSPLEALPALGSSLPRSPAPERGSSAGTDASQATGAESGSEGQRGERDAGRTARSYRVQVGRFSDENDARRLRDELAGNGLSPRVVRTERDGVVLYRVQVGTFRQKENADRQVDQLKQQRYEPYLADDEP